MAGAQRMGWCWRGGQGQMTEDLGGQGQCWGAAKGIPPAMGRTDSSRSSWLLGEEVIQWRMKELGEVSVDSIAGGPSSGGCCRDVSRLS